jgi:hypothetical protein
MHMLLEPPRHSTPHPTGLLVAFRSALNRLEIGEYTLIVSADKVIRIERAGDVCVYCDIPIAQPGSRSAAG